MFIAYSDARFGGAVLYASSGVETTGSACVLSTVSSLPYFSVKVNFGKKKNKEKVDEVRPMNAYLEAKECAYVMANVTSSTYFSKKQPLGKKA